MGLLVIRRVAKKISWQSELIGRSPLPTLYYSHANFGFGSGNLNVVAKSSQFTGRDLDIWVDGTRTGCDAYLELPPSPRLRTKFCPTSTFILG